MNTLLILAFFSGNVASLSILAALYFFLMKNANKLKINILGFLFIAIALRVLKSVIYFSGSIPYLAIAMGYLGLASIGPLIWLYFKYHDEPKIKRIASLDYLNFIPAIVGSIIIALPVENAPDVLYRGATTLLFIYIGFSFTKYKNTTDFKYNSWGVLLLILTVLMGIIFFVQFYQNTMMDYAMGTVAIAAILLALVVTAIKTNFVFQNRKSVKKLNPQLIQDIKKAIEMDKVYRNPKLTLDEFARTLNIPSYLVSRIIKREYEKTFPETINYFRINDAIRELEESTLKETKIESIAYTVGFNTPSAFYSAFKKETGTNPTEYLKRKKHLMDKESIENPIIPIFRSDRLL
ncbi:MULTISPECIES: helix-turn-helix domain-containing protein [Flavobacteriaceae]|uniref:helix-turn-helix domain-containing protein n=1 Tax=Flavobacteriaceae TaxID=49546 RepID=UPI001491569D|nr:MULTISPECIES: AraC family transcriptional regulator [Allomuricauda]MDC6366839.1 AraC family transcriptional regulator [Muricauda sp. AC10]